MKIKTEKWGELKDGTQVDLITLINDNAVKCEITNYGGTVVSWSINDKNGEERDVLIGYDKLEGFLSDSSYIGALIGRYGNRIDKATFEIEGKRYDLAANQGTNHLHGGNIGFDKVVWNYSLIEEDENIGVALTYLSKDMEEGYPGNLEVEVTYLLTNDNELKIIYRAMTDKTTHCNLTNHMYINLNGAQEDILKHQLKINADHYTPLNDIQIPTGEIKEVKGTGYDFTDFHDIGERIRSIQGGGYDHNYVVNKSPEDLEHIAEVFEPSTGIHMDVYTTEPGVQLYTAVHFDGSIVGKSGKKYEQFYSFCLETQHFPNTPNQSNFPSTLLKPGETYKQDTVYKLTVKQ